MSIDVAKEKLIAAQFRLQAVPTVYAFFHGQPVADLPPIAPRSSCKRGHRPIARPVEGRGRRRGGRRARDRAADRHGRTDFGRGRCAARGVGVRARSASWCPTMPRRPAALARALVAAGDLAEAEATLASLPPEAAKHAAIAPGARGARAGGRGAGGRHRGARSAARRRPRRSRSALRAGRGAAGAPATATPPPTPCSRSSPATASGTRARRAQRFLQLLEAQGIADPWARAQRRRLSAVLFT